MEKITDESFLCVRHAERHPLKEVGYNLPDAAFALGRTEGEREALGRLQNEDTLVLGPAHFIRGWAGLQIQRRNAQWGMGFWARVSEGDFAEFERRRHTGHGPLRGVIANQALFAAPTLGLEVNLEFRERGLRPFIRFTDPRHPLSAFQGQGLDEVRWRHWLSDAHHDGEPVPAGSPFEGRLEIHGWEIHPPEALGKPPVHFAAPPGVGDTVKLGFAVATAGLEGECSTINAGWWVRLDDVSRPNLWSGTLASNTRVQATIMLGSRIWLRPEQVVQHAEAEPSPS